VGSPVGSGAKLQPKSNVVHFGLKIGLLTVGGTAMMKRCQNFKLFELLSTYISDLNKHARHGLHRHGILAPVWSK